MRIALIAFLCALSTGVHAQEPAACPDSATLAVAAPLSRATLAGGRELLIVALGSSSTQGWMASDQAHTYPAVLQAALNRILPGAHVAVVNRGIGGEDAAEEVTRIDGDVIAIHPAMVIWQVGANGALRNIDPAVYKRLVSSGVARMQKAGIDVVLMDNQRSPAVLAAPEHLVIDLATAEVAVASGAALFARGAMMEEWRRMGMGYEQFISPDRMHHNDFGYRCLGEAVARSIAAGLAADRMAQAKSGAIGMPPGAAPR